nr:MAG TPA: minor capsid protein [Caudoviricetes sp.]
MAQTKSLEYYLAQARRISEHREAGAEKEIRKLYKEMLKDLQQFVSDVYMQYSKNDTLTYAMLQEAGYNARFLEEIEQRLNISTPKAAQKVQTLVEETYKLAYDGMVDGVVRASGGVDAAFAESVAITPEQIKRAVENPVSGLTLKDTLEKHRKDIIYSIKQTVGVGLMNGERYTTMARRIAEQVDGDYKKAIRIARTETHRVREGGNTDAAQSVDKELQNGTTGMRMCKTWRTMKDERVRPQRRRRGKKGWSTKMGRGANHMILDGQTVLADEDFDLQDGNTAPAPGSSGVAGHDINCRCYVSYEMMTDAEFFAKTGKHFPGTKGIENSENGGTIEPKLSKACQNIVDTLKQQGVEYIKVEKHAKSLTESEIISALAGGDYTSGSCSSVGIAYIGQKRGLNVLDFRGGKSMDYFSNKTAKVNMFKALGATPIEESSAKSNLTNGKRALAKMVKGKEYYLSVGRHAAIVRLNDDGVMQYLELQSATRSGWQDFANDVRDTLKWRFGCSSSGNHFSTAYLTDIDKFQANDDLTTLLGYINTSESEQRKGKHGTIK